MGDVAPRDLEGRGLERLADAARRATGGEVDESLHARGRERLERALERVDRAELPVASRWPWLAAAATLALAAALALVFWPASLAYTLDGAALHDNYVRAEAKAATVRFSDGTEVAFAPGARGRIAEVTRRGARVDVEQGRVSFRVVHRPSAAWTAGAGPFSILVTGTAFDAVWIDERFELDLHQGAVTVRGPLITDGLALRGGQRLVADVRRGTWTVDTLDSAQASAPPSSDATAATPSPATPREVGRPPAVGSAASPAPSARSGASWRELVARGDFAEVVSQADARGMTSAIDETPLSELAALADAARYVGRGDVARRAMLAERDRFPSSSEARSAAFLLGRLEEASKPADAVGWYDRYLAESPNGSLAGEALGRKMLTVKRSSGPTSARPIAEEYLRRFPGGPFAAAAGEITGDGG